MLGWGGTALKMNNSNSILHFLREYADALASESLIVKLSGNCDTEIRHITFDTRDMQSGTLFFCKGVHFRREYLEQASKSGAVAYVSEKEYEGIDLPFIIVSDIRHAMSISAILHYGNATGRLTTVGITGTKGKSTVSYYVKSILDTALPRECAIMSTIDNFNGETREESHLTTQEAIPLQRNAFIACRSGLTHLVIESSSQALKYERVYGIKFDAACIINIGNDHISPSEHADFDDYFSSKKKIFDSCKTACVNLDAEHSEDMLSYAREHAERVVTFGMKSECDIFGYGAEARADGISFSVRTPLFEREMHIRTAGLFNVSNALGAIALCHSLGISGESMAIGLERARVPGRMERYVTRDGENVVIVDYAHNSLSFEALYSAVKQEYKGKKIITVFGCPGVKALNRRADLGGLAGENSDYVVITEEDSGDEPFEHIAADIEQYVKAKGCPYTVIENRGEAIREAVIGCGRGKVVLITGKGNETTQRRGTVLCTTPSDCDYAARFVDELDKAEAHQKTPM